VNLIVAVTGASGAHAARILVERSPWPVSLIASAWGKDVYARECGDFEDLARLAQHVYADDDLAAPPSSGSVPTAGMVILPCSTDMLGKIAGGIADTLISRAAHCHLKERRPLVVCVRETPWTRIDLGNGERLAGAGAVVMPISPPFYMFSGSPPNAVTMNDLLGAFVDRILGILGHPPAKNWESRA
jgi:4-hydroxy-3-polyprenylbenzoate decarboxylase